jgi:hypothetical protein
VTPQRDPADSQDWFGISGTPSGEAFAAGLRAANGPAAPCGQ